ncbi:MAG: hypothetical protein LCH54_15555 [Bacteroidetes bacterium]|nr:hypothetical protein [Bacteroidota bacterium]
MKRYLFLLICLLAVSGCSTTGSGPARVETTVRVPVSPVAEFDLPATEFRTILEIDGDVFVPADSGRMVEIQSTTGNDRLEQASIVSPVNTLKPRKTIRARVFTSAVFDSSFSVFKRLRIEFSSDPAPHFNLVEVRLDTSIILQSFYPDDPITESPPIWQNYIFWICLVSTLFAGIFLGFKLR